MNATTNSRSDARASASPTSASSASADHRTAKLYRMVMPKHICPFGLKSRDLLQRNNYVVEDHWLTTREETDAYLTKNHVETTPQTFIEGQRIGGYDDLRRYFDMKVKDPNATSYRPVLTVFAVAAWMALAVLVAFAMRGAQIVPAGGGVGILQLVQWFIAFAMCLLAMLKLQDVEQFSTMFLGYDLLARKVVRYGYVYPYAELVAGLCMIAGGAFLWIGVPVAAFIGCIGAFSVFKAVYIDKRELKCACVGGGSNVPLGFVSLTENVMMVLMAVWMTAQAL